MSDHNTTTAGGSAQSYFSSGMESTFGDKAALDAQRKLLEPSQSRSPFAVSAQCTAGRNLLRSLAGTTPARAAPDVTFKKCCMRTGRYDGTLRNHYHR